MCLFTKTAVAVAATLCALNSLAQEAKGYIGAEYGAIRFNNTGSLASALVSTVGGSATSVQDTGMTVGRLFGGLLINENISAELGYVLTGNANASFSGVSRTNVSYSGSATQKASGFDYSALIRPSVSTGLNGLFFRVGGHSMTVDSSITLVTGVGAGVASGSTSGTGSLYGIGYDIELDKKSNVRLGYTTYNSVAGTSGSDVTAFTVGFVSKF
jgi:hypothetical protein